MPIFGVCISGNKAMKRVTIILLMLVTALLLGAWEARGQGSPTKFVGAKVVLVDEEGNTIPATKIPQKFAFWLTSKRQQTWNYGILDFAKNFTGLYPNTSDAGNFHKENVERKFMEDFRIKVENYWYTAPTDAVPLTPPYFVEGIQVIVYKVGSTTTKLISYSVERSELEMSKFGYSFEKKGIPELKSLGANEGDVKVVVKITLQPHARGLCTVVRGTGCPQGDAFQLYPAYKNSETSYSRKEESREQFKPPANWNASGSVSFKVWRGTHILYNGSQAVNCEFKQTPDCGAIKEVNPLTGSVQSGWGYWVKEICQNTTIVKKGVELRDITVNYDPDYAYGGREFEISVTGDKGKVVPGGTVKEGSVIKISAKLKHPSGCTSVTEVVVTRDGGVDHVTLTDGNGQYGVIANITKIVPVVTERKYKVAWTVTSAPLIKEIHTGTPSGTLVANGDQVSCDAKLYLKVNGKAKKVEAKYKGGVQQVLTPEGEFFTINPAEDIEDFIITPKQKFKVEFSPLTYGALSVVASESGSVNSGNEVYDGEVLTITATLPVPLQVQKIEVTTGDDQIHPYPLSGGAISIQHTITQAVKAITVQYTPAVYEVNGIAPGVDVKAVGGRVWNGSSFAEASVSAPISVQNGSKVIAGTKLRLSTSDPSVKRFVWKIAGVSATKPVVLAPVEFEVTGNVEEITTSTEDVKLEVNYTQGQEIGLKLVLHEGTVYKHDGTLKSTFAGAEVEPGEKVGIGSKLKVKVDGATPCKKIKGKVKVTMGGDVLEVDPDVPFPVTKEITKVEVEVESVHYTIKYTENGNSAGGDAPYSLKVFVKNPDNTIGRQLAPTGESIQCGETIHIELAPQGAKKRILQSLIVKLKVGPDENIYDPTNSTGKYDYVPHGDIVDIVAVYVEKTFTVRYTSPNLEVLVGGSLEVAQALAPNVTKTYLGGVYVYVRRKNLLADETANGLLVNGVPVNDGLLKDEDGYYYIVLATDIHELNIPKKSLSPGSVTFEYEVKEAGKADVDVEWLLPGRVPRQLFQGVTIQKGAKLRVKLSNFAPGYKYSCITVDGKLLDGVVRASNATDSYDFTVPDVSTYKITVWVVNTQSLTGDRFIRISKTEHGTIEMTDVDATPPHTLGVGEDYPTEPGRKFTVSITPAAGYVKVRDAFEGVHQLHNDEYIVPPDPGPGSHFTVWAEFDLSGGKHWPVLWDHAEHGKLEVKFGSRSLEAGESLPEGSTLFVRATPDNSYRVQSFKINGVEFVKSTENNGGIEEKYRVTDTVRILVAFAPVNSRFDRVEDVFGNVVLMPNPVVDGFTVTGASAAVHYQLLTTFGQQILEGNTTEQEQIRVELPALPSGLYLFVLTDAQGRKATLRVVKRQ